MQATACGMHDRRHSAIGRMRVPPLRGRRVSPLKRPNTESTQLIIKETEIVEKKPIAHSTFLKLFRIIFLAEKIHLTIQRENPTATTHNVHHFMGETP